MSGIYGGSAAAGGPGSSPSARAVKGRQKTSIGNTVETVIITAGPSGVFNDLYGLVIANVGALTTQVNIRDTPGGSIVATFEVPANDTRGFMVPAESSTDQTGSAVNWTAQQTAATNIEVTALYVANGP